MSKALSKLSPQSSALSPIPVEYLPPASNIDERVARVAAYYHGGRRSAAQLVVFNVLAGIELIGIRESIEHGAWLKWCDKNLPEGMSLRSATYFMGLAEALIPKLSALQGGPSGKEFDFRQLQLANGEITEKEIKPFAEAVQEVTNGKCFVDLLREYGLARDKQKPQHNQKRRTPEEILKDEANTAEEFRLTLVGDLQRAANTPELHQHWTTPNVQELLDYALSLTSALRVLKKSRTKGSPPRAARRGQKKGQK